METTPSKKILYPAWAVLILLLAGCFVVIVPFLSSLLWAVILTFSAWPLYKRLLARLGEKRRNQAALIMTLGIVTVLLLPFIIIAVTLAENMRALLAEIPVWVNSLSEEPPQWLADLPLVGNFAAEKWRDLGSDTAKLWAQVQRFAQPLSTGLLKGGIVFLIGLGQLTLSVLLSFFLFRDGVALAENLVTAIDYVAGERGKHLLDVAGKTVRGVVQGILGTALVQAVMAGIGFLIAGVPGASVLALLTFFLSIIPAGPPLIWIPATLWLFHQGDTGWAIFMLIWGIGVSSVDNVVKPWLISQGSNMPFVLIFVGVLGGALAFGFIGVFIGPTLLAVGFNVITEWLAEKRRLSLTSVPPEASPEPPSQPAV